MLDVILHTSILVQRYVHVHQKKKSYRKVI